MEESPIALAFRIIDALRDEDDRVTLSPSGPTFTIVAECADGLGAFFDSLLLTDEQTQEFTRHFTRIFATMGAFAEEAHVARRAVRVAGPNRRERRLIGPGI